MKDGIHTILGYKVYVENNRVLHAVTGEGVHYRVLNFYRYTPRIGWLRVAPMSPSALRRAIEHDMIRLA